MSFSAYQDRFGRRPLVAVMAHNGFTEITDFLVPFGVLSRSGVADVLAVSSGPGAVRLSMLQVHLPMSLAQFDQIHPEGSDYIIVPAMMPDDHPVLVEWIGQQARKGAILVSICLGALVVANTGCLDGRRATTYFAGPEERALKYPRVFWQKNVRYVQDENIISSAGISASIPISVALVEALAGRSRAEQLAEELGVTDWSPRHNSEVFLPKAGQPPVKFQLPGPDQEPVGIPLQSGIDEIALGLWVDAFCHTGRTRPYLLAGSLEPVMTRHGLKVLPDRLKPEAGGRVLQPLSQLQTALSIDQALAQIRLDYGPESARRVAHVMEYPAEA